MRSTYLNLYKSYNLEYDDLLNWYLNNRYTAPNFLIQAALTRFSVLERKLVDLINDFNKEVK